MKTKVVTILVHLTAWIIFLTLPFIFRPRIDSGLDINEQIILSLHLISFSLFLILIFYFHGYWMIPRLMLKKKWVTYIGLQILLLAAFVFFREFLFMRRPPGHFPVPPMNVPRSEFEFFKPAMGNSIFLYFVIVIISGGVRIMQEWIKAEKRAKQNEAERMAMELSLLRSQINPHFLFNTLNNIYSLALIKSEMTADAVMKLADIMRYLTEDSNSDKVVLNREVDYLRHYVELQRIRLESKMKIVVNLSGNFLNYSIPPLILMPFVENAFKYGTSSHQDTEISINLAIINDVLKLNIINRIFTGNKNTGTNGIGIKNTRQRLEHIYPGKHTLEITDSGKIFKVFLSINLV
jgi:two-component system, LytTR family, sensor kinase